MRKISKVVGLAAALTLCAVAVVGGIVFFAQKSVEAKNVEASAEEGIDSPFLKDMEEDKEIAEKICEKYNLDYESVRRSEMTMDMVHYWGALSSLKYEAELPLLGTETQSLESTYNDVFAASNKIAGDCIREVCKGGELNPEELKVKDLTVDELTEINALCYERSDHPKE